MSTLIPFPDRAQPRRVLPPERPPVTDPPPPAPAPKRQLALPWWPFWCAAALLLLATALGESALRAHAGATARMAAHYRSERQLGRVESARQSAAPGALAGAIGALAALSAADGIDPALADTLANARVPEAAALAQLDAALARTRAAHDRAIEEAAAAETLLTSDLRASGGASLVLALLLLAGAARWIAREQVRRAAIEDELKHALATATASTEDLRRLSHFGEMLQSCRSQAEALLMLRSAVPSLLGEVAGSIYLRRGEAQAFERAGGWGNQRRDQPASFDADDCWAIRRNQPHPPADDAHGAACAHHEQRHDSPAAALCVPLTAQGETIGVLCLDAMQPFDHARRRLCRAIAEQLSLSLSNLILQESLRLQSLRDPLTGLFNRRYLDESLPRELARAARRRMPLSLLVVDIDHFKRINDGHGHDAGDALLSSVGALLAARSREEDIACRLGGEEFMLILPDAALAAAARRAEQLREAIGAMVVRFNGRDLPRVTVSIGVAQWQDGMCNVDELRIAADRALYAAKDGGRDRVVAAAPA